MELTFRKHGTGISFSPKGRVVGQDAQKLGDALEKALELGGALKSARVHLGGLSEMADEAVDVLADWHTRYGARGVALRFAGAPVALRERLRARGVLEFHRVFDGDEDDRDEPIVV